MPIQILGTPDTWNSWTFEEEPPFEYGDTYNIHNYTLPAGSGYVICCLGVTAKTPTSGTAPDSPHWYYTRWGGYNLTERVNAVHDVDGGCQAGIGTMIITTATGLQELHTRYDTARIYGSGLFFGMTAFDRVPAHPFYAIGTDSGSGTSVSCSYIIPNANYSLLAVLAIRGTAAVTKTGTGTGEVLMDQVDATNQCRTVVVLRTGADPLSASFSWSGAVSYALASVTIMPALGGNQISVIG
jgi:hypothetical protein